MLLYWKNGGQNLGHIFVVGNNVFIFSQNASVQKNQQNFYHLFRCLQLLTLRINPSKIIIVKLFYNLGSLQFLVEIFEMSFSLQLQSFCEDLTDKCQIYKNFQSYGVYLSKLSLYRKNFRDFCNT